MQRSSISTTVRFLGAARRIERVSPPGPGPISKTSALRKSGRFCFSMESRNVTVEQKILPEGFFGHQPAGFDRFPQGGERIYQRLQSGHLISQFDNGFLVQILKVFFAEFFHFLIFQKFAHIFGSGHFRLVCFGIKGFIQPDNVIAFSV